MAKKDVNEIPDETDLTFIQRDNNVHGILQCYIAVYTSLEYQNKLKTWSEIADSLRKMDNHALAGKICGGKRLRNNATGATPPPIRKMFSKRQVKDLSDKIKNWKLKRKFVIQKLENIAELPHLKDGNTKVAVSDAHWILQLLGIVVDDTKAINIQEIVKQCEVTCLSEHSVYQAMMEEFMKFGSNIRKMFGLSEMDTIKYPVSFDALPPPRAENLKKEIQKLRQEVELIDDVFEFVENNQSN